MLSISILSLRTTNTCRMPMAGNVCPLSSEAPYGACPAGSYCPAPDRQIVCPEGHWCAEGVTEPRRCGLIMDCRAPGNVCTCVHLAIVSYDRILMGLMGICVNVVMLYRIILKRV